MACHLRSSSDADLTCAYCGRSAELLDHLNSTVFNKKASGYFAELANLVPACRPCNESRGSKLWEPWLRSKHADEDGEAIERRVAVMRRFEQWRTAECLVPRESGTAEQWAEYDRIRAEIHDLLRRARRAADGLRAAVTADHEERRKSASFPLHLTEPSSGPTGCGTGNPDCGSLEEAADRSLTVAAQSESFEPRA